ncbi:MAG TPA: chemotaxis protein CheR, partial [Trichocoleus sp.]
DVGRPLQDLEVYYQPRELRPFISMAYSERQMIALPGVEWQTRQGENLFLDVQIVPLMNSDGKVIGVSINFDDVSRYVHLQAELEEANHELETAYEELQSTNEELETTNEELQSTNEELETTNEEL